MQAKTKNTRTTEQVLAKQKTDVENSTFITKKTGNALVADADNAWITVSAELDKFLGGALLKFNKQGEYALNDVDTLAAGTRVVVHADEMTLGWQKWQDGKPVPDGKRLGRIADKFVPPKRDELGDTDQRQWEVGDDGKPRDPWAFQMSVPLTALDGDGQTYNFTVTSKGGLRCLSALARAYGRRVRDVEPPGLPIAELRSDWYKHREYGKIFIPLMPICNWTGPDGTPLGPADDLNDAIGF
jgi:hypothetical protein